MQLAPSVVILFALSELRPSDRGEAGLAKASNKPTQNEEQDPENFEPQSTDWKTVGAEAPASVVWLEVGGKSPDAATASTNDVRAEECIEGASKWRTARRRGKLIRDVFKACDNDEDGHLNSEDLRRFAVHTGFDGGDSEWTQEYKVLCEDRACDPGTGFTCEKFIELLNDSSDLGCFCTDDELQTMLSKLKEI